MVELKQDDVNAGLVSTFLVGDRYFGINTSLVQEVVRFGEITPVHHSPEFILGVMNLRGRIVTVIDLCRKLSGKLKEATDRSRIFIVDWRQEYVGLVVDDVGEVVPFERSALFRPPDNLPMIQAEMLQGVFHAGKILVALLNVERILDDSLNQEKRLGT